LNEAPVITAPEIATEPPEGRPAPRRVRRLPIVVAILTVAFSGTGLLLLQTGSGSETTAAGISSSSDFLQAASPTGIPRIRIWQDGDPLSIQNGDSIAVGDDLVLAVTVNPYPPTQFDIEVDFALSTPDGTPIADADLTVVWDMLIMGHGPFQTEFENVGDGHYRAGLDLFMFGPWDLALEISPTFDVPDDLSVSLYVWPE
jgi:hypothetical protein